MGDALSMDLDSHQGLIGCPILRGFREGWGFGRSQAEPAPSPPTPSPPRQIIVETPQDSRAPTPQQPPIAPAHRRNKAPRRAGPPLATPDAAYALPARHQETAPSSPAPRPEMRTT